MKEEIHKRPASWSPGKKRDRSSLDRRFRCLLISLKSVKGNSWSRKKVKKLKLLKCV